MRDSTVSRDFKMWPLAVLTGDNCSLAGDVWPFRRAETRWPYCRGGRSTVNGKPLHRCNLTISGDEIVKKISKNIHRNNPLLALLNTRTVYVAWKEFFGAGRSNLVPRAFPSKNGSHFLREKPWGRGCGHSHFLVQKSMGTRLGTQKLADLWLRFAGSSEQIAVWGRSDFLAGN